MSNIVLNTLKRTMENTKASALGISNEIIELTTTLDQKKNQLDALRSQVQELELAIKQLETPSASKNKKAK